MIYREYQLNSGSQEQPLDMPAGAEIVSLDRSPENRIRLSVLLDETEVRRQTRMFRCVPSGSKIPDIAGKALVYIGSVNLLPTAWHVHEVVTLAPAAPVAPTEPVEPVAPEPTPAAPVAPEPTPAPEVTPEVTPEPTPAAAPAAAAPAKTNPFKTAK